MIKLELITGIISTYTDGAEGCRVKGEPVGSCTTRATDVADAEEWEEVPEVWFGVLYHFK